jgi:hypothetical protein
MSAMLSIIAASRRRVSFDPDAADYFARIVSAGSSISAANKTAVDAFVKGCKTDGIWSAIKACCLLAGPDDLTGALVPLVGPVPTNVSGNFVAADYNRTTGLIGDGATKAISANINHNSTEQNNKHLSVVLHTRGTVGSYIGVNGNGGSNISYFNSSSYIHRVTSNVTNTINHSNSVGFVGLSRNNASNYQIRVNNNTTTQSRTSDGNISATIGVFRHVGATNFTNAGIKFYSFGESLDLALLDARISTYMASIT